MVVEALVRIGMISDNTHTASKNLQPVTIHLSYGMGRLVQLALRHHITCVELCVKVDVSLSIVSNSC